ASNRRSETDESLAQSRPRYTRCPPCWPSLGRGPRERILPARTGAPPSGSGLLLPVCAIRTEGSTGAAGAVALGLDDRAGGQLESPLQVFRPPWRNRYTRQVEGLCSKGRAGSSPVGGTLFTARRWAHSSAG